MTVGERLAVRENLLQRRRNIVDVQLIAALFGFILMLVENELYLLGCITKSSITSIVLKSFISYSTIILLVSIILYYVTVVQLRMTDNHLNSWRLAVTFRDTYCKIFLELFVCALHPLPINITIPISKPNGEIVNASSDAIMSILMILRVYLLGRMAVVHNKLLAGTATHGLGALNKVKIDALFLFKGLMSTHPGNVLIVIMISILLINSWAMRTCEAFYQFEKDHSDYWTMMWMVSVTFLTIGYGDIYPISVCGRFVSVATGLMGVGTTALLIAVLAQKLEPSRAEKYVYNFVLKAQLDKRRKTAAADAIKNWFQLCRLRRSNVMNMEYIRVHGKLLQAINAMQEAKRKRDSTGESTIGFIEISKGMSDVEKKTEDVQRSIRGLKSDLVYMQKMARDLQCKFNDIHRVLVRDNTRYKPN
ncbi:small conductance calcium-activated potassium channel protein 2-like [Saccostrea cucullata]|uniref:small conductance calcium-activated potassium channel protein 2-like n=1 Tax=Saccostrea cuccullata TaxID=36930 RepID=UPI002ED3CCCF